MRDSVMGLYRPLPALRCVIEHAEDMSDNEDLEAYTQACTSLMLAASILEDDPDGSVVELEARVLLAREKAARLQAVLEGLVDDLETTMARAREHYAADFRYHRDDQVRLSESVAQSFKTDRLGNPLPKPEPKTSTPEERYEEGVQKLPGMVDILASMYGMDVQVQIVGPAAPAQGDQGDQDGGVPA